MLESISNHIDDNNSSHATANNKISNDAATASASTPVKLSNRAKKRIRADRHKAKYNELSSIDRLQQYEQWKAEHSTSDVHTLTLNELFIEYYKSQRIMADTEWPPFIHSLQTVLPTTFRLGTINAVHQQLLLRLQTDGFGTRNSDGTPIELLLDNKPTDIQLHSLTWYPNSLAWYINAGKTQLRKIPQLKQFREFLIGETDSGNVTRQEAVSMIPPLLLDIAPHHYILDMCAAPGSKTGQLLEMLHSGGTEQSSVPTGCVIANDADSKRAYMLVHQLKRLGSPNFLVTTHEGQRFPTIYKYKSNTTNNTAHHSVSSLLTTDVNTNNSSRELEAILFDRILCDVPCSGDGTLRKSPNLWRRWSTAGGNGLHTLQLMIARRSVQLLKPGGIMVYSTCSLNPIENEAVVAELIRRSNGTIQLIDCSDKLPGLIRQPGLSTWRVYDKDTAVEFDPSIHKQTERIKPSHFPPSSTDAQTINLNYCIRILPHHQDTGGFFIAVLRKLDNETSTQNTLAALSTPLGRIDIDNGAATDDIYIESGTDAIDLRTADLTAVNELAADDDNDNNDTTRHSNNNMNKINKQDKISSTQQFKEDPFCAINSAVATELIDFFGLPTSINTSNFWTRHEGNKRLFFVAPSISNILQCDRNCRVKVVNAGSRCLEYNRAKSTQNTYTSQYRIAQEGVDYLLPYCSKQVLHCNYNTFKHLLNNESVLIQPYINDSTSELGNDIRAAQNGCVICVLSGDQARNLTVRDSGLAVTAWMTNKSIQLMITKDRKVSLANLLAGNTNNQNSIVNDNNQNNVSQSNVTS